MNQPPSRIGIFWDIETCPPPSVLSGHEVVDAIRRVALSFGIVTMLKAYVEYTREPTRWFQDPQYESELQLSGVSLTQCLINDGTPSGTGIVGRTLAADMLAYAIDNPAPSIIMVISGDNHIAYPLSLLRLRRYDILVISPSNVHAGLKSQASESFIWEHHVLGGIRDTQEHHSATQNIQNHGPTSSVRNSGPRQSTPSGPRSSVGPGGQDLMDGYRYRNERMYMNQTPSAFSVREQSPWAGRSEVLSPSSASFTHRNQFVRPTPVYNGLDNLHRGFEETHDVSSHKPSSSAYDGRSNDTPRPEARKEPTAHYAGDVDKGRNSEPDSAASTMNFPFIEKQPSEEASSGGTGGAKNIMPNTSFNAASPAFVPRAAASVSSPMVTTVPVPQTPKSAMPNAIQQPPQSSGSQSNLTPQVTGGPLADGILQPLLNRLESLQMEGKTRPLRSVVGMELSSNNKAMYKQAGVGGFSEYVTLAEKRGMVNLGGVGGSAWIELNPGWREISAWL